MLSLCLLGTKLTLLTRGECGSNCYLFSVSFIGCSVYLLDGNECTLVAVVPFDTPLFYVMLDVVLKMSFVLLTLCVPKFAV